MKTLRNLLLITSALGMTLLASTLLRADSVSLKCKRTIAGRLVDKEGDNITLETFFGRVTIPKDRVKKHNEKKVSPFEKYEAKIEELEVDAAGQVKLGKLCEKGKGFKKAREHYKKALELDPKSKKAKQLLKSLKKKIKKYRKKFAKPKAIKFDVACKQDLTREEIDWLADRVKASSRLLARLTNGEAYYSEVTFKNKSEHGFFVFDKTFTGTPGFAKYPSDCYMARMNWGPTIILHEVAHIFMHLPDDRDPDGPCIMAHNWRAGFCSKCKKRAKIGSNAKFLPEEIPDLPETKIIIKGCKPKKKKK